MLKIALALMIAATVANVAQILWVRKERREEKEWYCWHCKHGKYDMSSGIMGRKIGCDKEIPCEDYDARY